MRRPLRYCPAGIPVHIIQRGVNRSRCFGDDEDRAVFINILGEEARSRNVEVHAWVLMGNHFHLLVTPNKDWGASRMMQHLGRRYVKYFNRRHSRTGTLWEGRFRSSLVQTDRYLLACQRYIELNPVRAGLVKHPVEYHWSSYHSNACGRSSELVKPHDTYLSLGKDEHQRRTQYQGLFDETLPEEEIEAIRFATNKGLIFGSSDFKETIELESGQKSRLMKPGPKTDASR